MIVRGAIGKFVVIQVMGLILHTSCHRNCVHDSIKPTRGISPQFYNFRKTIDRVVPENTVKSQSTSQKSAGVEVPKTVHRSKRSTEAKSAKSDQNSPAESSASDSQQVNIPGRQKNLSAQARRKRPNAKQHHKELLKPIRIKIFIQNEYISFKMTSEFFKRLNKSVHRAVKKIHNILSVIPVRDRLRFNRTPERICNNFWTDQRPSTRLRPKRCAAADPDYSGETCIDDFKIPDAHLRGYPIYGNNTPVPTQWLYKDGAGILDADMVLYVHAKNTILCKQNGLIAYATYCQVDQYHRPIAGLINYCPKYLKDPLYNEDITYMTSLHEILHVLGFSKDLFDKFQSCEMKINNLEAANKTVIQWICGRRKNSVGVIDGVKNILTPAVIKETRDHFGCPTVNGCPLENHVVRPVTTSSHWEGRFMQGSLMAPTISRPHLTVLDRITLAAFEDMGWYHVNYDYAEDLAWGKGAGCEFLSKKACPNESSEYFCTDNSASGCHYLHLDKAVCKTDKYLDGCMIYKTTPGMECWKAENRKENEEFGGEIFSADSRCFESDLHRINSTVSTSGKLQGGCYEHRCSDNETYEVRVDGSEWKICSDHEYIVFDGYRGGIVCPPAAIICRNVSHKITDPDSTETEPTEVDRDMFVCGNFTTIIPGLSDQLQEGVAEGRNVSDDLVVGLVEVIRDATDICEDCVTDVRHKGNDTVCFILQIPSNISAGSGVDADSYSANKTMASESISMEERCVDIVKNMLESSSNGTLRLNLGGNEYITDEMDFDSPLEAVTRIKVLYPTATGRNSTGVGMYVAAAVGSVCGTALLIIGAVVYWKNAVHVAVAPVPATPIRTDVRYLITSGSITVSPSENGSAGQLPNVYIP